MSYLLATRGVVVDLSITGAQATRGAGHDTLLNVENLVGSRFGDLLTGDTGENVLNGAYGADTLVGGGGADTLIGGLGADVFRFLRVADSLALDPDQITGFVRGSDHIDLTAFDGTPLVALPYRHGLCGHGRLPGRRAGLGAGGGGGGAGGCNRRRRHRHAGFPDRRSGAGSRRFPVVTRPLRRVHFGDCP
ncbi:MAG: M10 family metallopeptidase C-terminal domain-containing protein [Exiguobacterium profundum]|nr:MAG: M10 family metallopeptidase C-terminal domain-containing protein [Exiguobacterium profundum]